MLDRLDCRLLELLQADARCTNADLAAEVGLSVSACAKRIARFWAEGLIERTTAVLNRRRFREPVTAAVMVTLSAPKARMEEEFAARMAGLEVVQQCHVVTGDFDYLLIVQARTIAEYHDFAQATFGQWSTVQTYKTVFLLRTYKNVNRLPPFCLQLRSE